MGTRLLRLSAATILIGAVSVTLAPHATSYVSTSAVVNAPVLSIKAPFDGHVLKPSASVSTPLAAQQIALELAADRQSSGEVEVLRASAEVVEAKMAAIDVQTAELASLRGALEKRLEVQQEQTLAWLEARQEEIHSGERGAMVRRDLLSAELDRTRRLVETGTLSRSSFEGNVAELAIVDQEVAQQRARKRTLQVEADALRQGLAVDVQISGGGYFRQRLDEIEIRRAELTAQRAILFAELRALRRQTALAQAEADEREVFRPKAGYESLIWKASAGEGTPISAGDELIRLLDCTRRFVEVSISESYFERIKRGDSAEVLLKGSNESFTATVEAVRGAGAQFGRPAMAAAPQQAGTRELIILVRLDPAEIFRPEVAASFCDVGRTAEVRFARSVEPVVDRIASAAEFVFGWLSRAPAAFTQTKAVGFGAASSAQAYTSE